ncbi:site-specific recombinase, phage integrase family [gamma proteobacterium NOR5-3]|nr:site-specific recombinase, phage integrase family [gamma proteobacterium NOR5-3]
MANTSRRAALNERVITNWLASIAGIEGDHALSDTSCRGLRLRVKRGERLTRNTVRGAANWGWRGRDKSARIRSAAIGPLADVGLGEARSEADTLRAEARTKTLARGGATADTITLTQALELHYGTGRLKASTLTEYRRVVRIHLDTILSTPLIKLDPSTLAPIIRRVIAGSEGKRPAPSTADKLIKLIRAARTAVYAETLDERFLLDVTTALRRKVAIKPCQPRLHAVIHPEQLPEWWSATEAEDPLYRDFLRFLVLTGLRKMEAAALSWAEVDLNRGLVTIPATRAKSGRDRERALGQATWEILLRRRKAVRGSCWVFPTSLNGRGHIVDPKKAVARIEKRCSVHASSHALRRTFVSRAREVLEREDVAWLVGHAVAGVTEEHYHARSPEANRKYAQAAESAVLEAAGQTTTVVAPVMRLVSGAAA